MELLPVEEIKINQTKINKIDHLVKSIYRFIIYSGHHIDGNSSRVTRIAKNWMLMFDLYPPIYINDAPQKKEYISTLSKSFRELDNSPKKWNDHAEAFFEQELDRLVVNGTLLYETVNRIGVEREKVNKNNT